jgi:hypothetical protein
MFKMFLKLNWKEFNRGASISTKLVAKILKWFWIIYFAFISLGLAVIASDLSEPFLYVNKQLIYFFIYLIVIRYFVQSLPVLNIKSFLLTPIKTKNIIRYVILKTFPTYFNLLPLFFLIPFTLLIASNDNYDTANLIYWNLNILGIIFLTNLLNFLLNNKKNLVYIAGAILALIKALDYYSIVDFTIYSQQFFYSFYETPYLAIFTWAVVYFLYNYVFKFFNNSLYIDKGIQTKIKEAKQSDYSWLDRFGKTAIFIKNDLRLLKRSKRARSTVYAGLGFLFYAFLIFPAEEILGPAFSFFGYLFSSAGFLFMFGSFVPSWDSQYYPLMMTQNIEYKEYLNSKWSLLIIGTVISTILASIIYSFVGINSVYAIIGGAAYNIGVNGYLTLWAGAYTKSPIDLNSSANAFGDKKAFNAKTMLVGIPQMVVPVVVYYFGNAYFDHLTACLLVASLGVLGIFLKPIAFSLIMKAYKTEKYSTLKAYKSN